MSIGISSSSARLLHSGIHHINLTSFVFGPNHAPLPISAAFSRFLQHNLSRSTHIFITGGGRPPAILFRFVNCTFGALSSAPTSFGLAGKLLIQLE